MFEALARFVTRRRRLVLIGSLIAVMAAGALGVGVIEKLSAGGFEDPSAESTLAERFLEEHFDAGDPNLILLVRATEGTVDDLAVEQAGFALTDELSAEENVNQVVSYWTLGSVEPLRSTDQTKALVLARIHGTEDEIRDRVEELSPKYTRTEGIVTVGVGGFEEVFRQVGTTIEADLARAEAMALPITLVLLVLVFGSLVAAGLPLAIGIIAILGTFLILSVLASLTQVSIFALNMTTALGLGLAIDYSLFVVSRFREELRKGLDTPAAVMRTMQTAGRTVAFSGLTVAVSLSALLVFPLAFLRSFAYAGVAVVLMAVGGAIVFLPAVLAALGPRVDKGRIFRRKATRAEHEGFWHSIASLVMRRPVPIALVVVAVLILLGTPFLRVNFGLPDDRVLPPDASSHLVMDEIREGFASNEASALSVVAPGVGDPAGRLSDIDAYAKALSSVEHTARVDAVTGHYVDGEQVAPDSPFTERFVAADATFLSVVPAVEPFSGEGEGVVRDLRAVPAPFDEILVGGPSALLVDAKSSLLARLPLALGLIGLATFVLLFLMFGSIVVPAKALVLNLLSLTATFGAMVWVFQEGNLSGLLGFTATGMLDTTTPILMFCVAFGLSMDYEVFVLSRIKEEYDRTGDNTASVALGLERTGRIVTAAAAIIAVVFISFASSGITFIKLFGVGLAMAVLMDATVVRGLLVPAFMRLAGDANWWLPGFLKPLYVRFHIREAVEHEASAGLEPQPVPAELVPTDADRRQAIGVGAGRSKRKRDDAPIWETH